MYTRARVESVDAAKKGYICIPFTLCQKLSRVAVEKIFISRSRIQSSVAKPLNSRVRVKKR